MNENVYLWKDVRKWWEDKFGEMASEMINLFLQHGPVIFNKYVKAKKEIIIFLEDKPATKKLFMEDL